MDLARFPCGRYYFEDTRRMFAGEHPCMDCVAIHNNWIIGTAAKVYRLKEHLLWHIDDGGYYSSTTTKYLQYYYDAASAHAELVALKAAFRIAHATSRVLILPVFRCHNCAVFPSGRDKRGCSGSVGVGMTSLSCGQLDMDTPCCVVHSPFHLCSWTDHTPVFLPFSYYCPLPGDQSDVDACAFTALFNVAALDAALGGRYREHMFRYSPLVPAALRLPPPSSYATTHTTTHRADDVEVAGATARSLREVIDKVRASTSPVVVLRGLSNAVLQESLVTSKRVDDAAEFEALLDAALVPGFPRQHTRTPEQLAVEVEKRLRLAAS